MSKKLTKEEQEKQLREEADERMQLPPEKLDELHSEELAEADLLDRMDIDPHASDEAKGYIKAFAGEGGHDSGFEEREMIKRASSTSAMDVSHDDKYALFDMKELDDKKGGKTRKSKPKSKRRTKRKSVKKSKRMRRRKSKRTSRRTRRQYGGMKSPGLSAKLSALRTAVIAGGSAVHTELLRQLILKETDEEVANTLRESIDNPELVESPHGSVERYRLSFRAIEKHLFQDRAIEFSPALGRYILSGVFVVPDDLPESYLCPIGLEIMTDPVINVLGFTYERANIEEWNLGHNTNPSTGEVLPPIAVGQLNAGQPNKRLMPNIAVLSAINYKTGRDLYGPPPPPPP